MARKIAPGYIGLGSRLFVTKEKNDEWGTAASANLASFEQFNVYPLPGGRPAKATTPIEVSQLYPSAIRRKSLKNVSSLEGAYSFSLPINSNQQGLFWEMITGDASLEGSQALGTPVLVDDGGFLSITSTNVPATSQVGKTLRIAATATNTAITDGVVNSISFSGTGGDEITVVTSVDYATLNGLSVGEFFTLSGVVAGGELDQEPEVALVNASHEVKTISGATITIDTPAGITATTNALIANNDDDNLKISFTGEDDSELSVLVGDHTITASTNSVSVVTSTVFPNFTGAIVITAVNILANVYTLGETTENSYATVSTIGVNQVVRQTGLMAQTASLNVSVDEVATMDVTFLGKNEKVLPVGGDESNIGNMFKSTKIKDDGDLDGTGATETGEANCPFGINGSTKRIRELKPGAAFRETFDNFNDVYPSHNAKLYIVKKVANFDVGDNTNGQYQKWVENAWVNTGNSETDIISEDTLVPFADLSLTINNNLDFSNYVNGTLNRNKPIQTTYRDISFTVTVPYNEYTYGLVTSHFDFDSFAAMIVIESDASNKVEIFMPEICITGDGGLGDIPEGEITLPLTFGVYASHESDNQNEAFDHVLNYSPIRITVNST